MNKPEKTPTGRPPKHTKLYTHEQLVKDVALTSDYPEYEVKDILNHYVYHVAMALKNQPKPVEIWKIGKLRRMVWGARRHVSNYTGSVNYLPARVSVSFGLSLALKRTINLDFDPVTGRFTNGSDVTETTEAGAFTEGEELENNQDGCNEQEKYEAQA